MKKLLTTGALLLCSLLTSFAQFSGSGSGTQSDPYRIYTKDEFNELRSCLNQTGVYFKLMKDLDLSDWLSENYLTQGWRVVGSTSAPIKGILDETGKTFRVSEGLEHHSTLAVWWSMPTELLTFSNNRTKQGL